MGDGEEVGGWTQLQNDPNRGFGLVEFEESKIPAEKKGQIGGYPTIVLEDDKGNKIADYTGDRSAKDMKAFVKRNQKRGGRRKSRRRRRRSRRRRKKSRKKTP